MSNEDAYAVYVQVDDDLRIIDINSSAFVSPDWGFEIDRGYGDKYHHAQGNYFPDSIYVNGSILRYKLVTGSPVKRSDEEIESDMRAKESNSD